MVFLMLALNIPSILSIFYYDLYLLSMRIIRYIFKKQLYFFYYLLINNAVASSKYIEYILRKFII